MPMGGSNIHFRQNEPVTNDLPGIRAYLVLLARPDNCIAETKLGDLGVVNLWNIIGI